jgi:DNA-binding NtrC family response regulator
LLILIISRDWTIQNMVEQVSITCGCASIAAASALEAETKLAQLGYGQFALVVIHADVLGEGGADLQMAASHLLQTWAGQYPRLSVMFLGTALQKYAILAARLSLAPFVTAPFSPHDLMQAIQPLLPQTRRDAEISS